MSEQLNINNLLLDDNVIEVIPDGDYHFKVESYEVGYATSDKLPPNTQQLTIYLSIPFFKDGELRTARLRAYLNIYKKALFAVRQFVECIGMVPEKGKMQVDLTKINGRNGICAVTTAESNNGNEYNRVQQFYPPSKAPAIVLNGDAWNKADGFMEVPEDDPELPFI